MRRLAGTHMCVPETSRMRLVFRTVHAPFGEVAHARPRAVPYTARLPHLFYRSAAGHTIRKSHSEHAARDGVGSNR